jgi:HD-GYP domain-containing protein (c-di-GMP phosphodiesterase class II)
LLNPGSSFVFALLSSIVITALSLLLLPGVVPNVPLMGTFFLIAFISFAGSKKLGYTSRRLKQSFVGLAETTSRVLGVRDPYTQEHEQRVGELAREVGRRMNLSEDEQLGLYLGGVLHDIGKIAIPETILTKPGDLKEVEWEMIKSHPEVGFEQILEGTDFPWPVAEMTLHHHERLDGSGYPHGLEGNELSLEVRILGVCDVVEAMSTRRPYRSALTREEVLAEVKSGKGNKYDPRVVDVIEKMIEAEEVNFG